MKIIRIFFKILLFPVSLLLTIIVPVSMFLVERCAGILNIFSGIMFLGALAAYAQYLFGCYTLKLDYKSNTRTDKQERDYRKYFSV